jgi:hypothetical protein
LTDGTEDFCTQTLARQPQSAAQCIHPTEPSGLSGADMNIKSTALQVIRAGCYAFTAAAFSVVVAAGVCVTVAFPEVPAGRVVTMLQYRPAHTVAIAVYRVTPTVGLVLLSRGLRNCMEDACHED